MLMPDSPPHSDRIRQTLAFHESVIKSGEGYTETVVLETSEALAALERLEEQYEIVLANCKELTDSNFQHIAEKERLQEQLEAARREVSEYAAAVRHASDLQDAAEEQLETYRQALQAIADEGEFMDAGKWHREPALIASLALSNPASRDASEPVEATQGPPTGGNPSSRPGSEASSPASSSPESMSAAEWVSAGMPGREASPAKRIPWGPDHPSYDEMGQ